MIARGASVGRKLFISSEELEGLKKRRLNLMEYLEKVMPIVKDVKERGVEAALEYSEKFDKRKGAVGVNVEECAKEVNEDFKKAVKVALNAVEEFAKNNLPKDIYYSFSGLRISTLFRAIKRVGIYVPGGAYPYPSTAIMTAGLAKAVGVKEIVVSTPPGEKCIIPPPTAYVLQELADEVNAIGGAQGIALLAYHNNVHKIYGPGGPYVQAAKIAVSSDVPIDFVAGPTELVVIAEDGDPLEIANDLLAQAEHGPLSFALLLTPSEELGKKVEEYVKEAKNVYIYIVNNLKEAVEITNEIAPEHVSIYGPLREVVSGAISHRIPSPLLDYSAGPSHVLPTSRWALARGGLTPWDFMRWTFIVQGKPERELIEAAKTLAKYEGMKYHLNALEVID